MRINIVYLLLGFASATYAAPTAQAVSATSETIFTFPGESAEIDPDAEKLAIEAVQKLLKVFGVEQSQPGEGSHFGGNVQDARKYVPFYAKTILGLQCPCIGWCDIHDKVTGGVSQLTDRVIVSVKNGQRI
ncbi:hypothetical protein J3R30DRAFT_3462378 [Lentinula aciculospora]|uniref:Uncharacterized protein n=1 Tax=Lentinula aciculospora TaxID=153920 RepID=A0A9W9AFP5_9AGAR|nr:hypothetical protein J3R30DRAFT_3462378 [Lentinula aciculospora]